MLLEIAVRLERGAIGDRVWRVLASGMVFGGHDMALFGGAATSMYLFKAHIHQWIARAPRDMEYCA